MSYRVVIPRSIPFDDSNRVQKTVWKLGYSTRIAARDTTAHGRVTVEFLRIVPELPDPSEVGGFADDLDALLAGTRVHTEATGSGAWLETVQRPPKLAHH